MSSGPSARKSAPRGRFGGSRPGAGAAGSHGGNRSQGPRRGGGGGGSRQKRAVKKIDVSRYINKNAVAKKPEPYTPKHHFADFNVDARLKRNIAKKGYVTPTPIQDKTIPDILVGRDIVGIANTGTGKTAAFLIPLINKRLANPSERVLIMAPTRELAQQIEEEFRGFAAGLGLHSVTAVGGLPIYRQIAALRRGTDFLIGTPGRLKDLLDRKAVDLGQYKNVVLDEADRMLDMGFIDVVRMLLSQLPKPRHTLFFSATLSREIEQLIGSFLMNPVNVSVKTGDTSSSVFQDVVHVTDPSAKMDMLHDLLSKQGFEKVLVFGRTKHGVERLSQMLGKRGHAASAIHGDKNQRQRERALSDFKQNRTKILVATDVAARGLDIPNVSHVINYDVPGSHEDYVHRIGRTGRAGKVGTAITFVD